MEESDNKVIKDLMQEHAFARKAVTALEKANQSYVLGNKEALNEILEILSTLSTFYPMHNCAGVGFEPAVTEISPA
jgi:hypothetical protein